MAKAHSFLWRAPGRKDEERKRFSALMRQVGALRLRRGGVNESWPISSEQLMMRSWLG